MDNFETANIIFVEQLPVISQQLALIRDEFKKQTDEALALECTEDTVKEIKAKRAEITKVFEACENKRKEAKNKILEPYKQFEEIYKGCVTDVYAPAKVALDKKVNDVESSLKSQKADEIREYFDELAESLHIDFVEYERLGINVTLTSSAKKLKEQVKTQLEKISADVEAINAMEHNAEIMAEYTRSLNLGESLINVNRRIEEAENAKKRIEEIAKIKEREDAKAFDVLKTAEEFSAPTIEESTEESEESESNAETEQIFKATFTVYATRESIKSLVNYMKERGIKYEQQ